VGGLRRRLGEPVKETGQLFRRLCGQKTEALKLIPGEDHLLASVAGLEAT
jgi:hypothetical protein